MFVINQHGNVIDGTIEQNIKTKSKYGFNVFVIYPDGIYGDGKKEVCVIYRNITQVHINFEDGRVAFESDILMSGNWKSTKDISHIIISKAEKLYECNEFYKGE